MRKLIIIAIMLLSTSFIGAFNNKAKYLLSEVRIYQDDREVTEDYNYEFYDHGDVKTIMKEVNGLSHASTITQSYNRDGWIMEQMTDYHSEDRNTVSYSDYTYSRNKEQELTVVTCETISVSTYQLESTEWINHKTVEHFKDNRVSKIVETSYNMEYGEHQDNITTLVVEYVFDGSKVSKEYRLGEHISNETGKTTHIEETYEYNEAGDTSHYTRIELNQETGYRKVIMESYMYEYNKDGRKRKEIRKHILTDNIGSDMRFTQTKHYTYDYFYY
jgi:hypothetical protein